jgi:hypothetical protein
LHGERVEVHVQVERRPEALDRGHGSATRASDAAALGSEALEGQRARMKTPWTVRQSLWSQASA